MSICLKCVSKTIPLENYPMPPASAVVGVDGGDGGDQASSGIARILCVPVLHTVLVSNVALFAIISDNS